MKRRAQTLLELVIASGVISVASIAVLTLIVRTIDVGQQTIRQTEATNYAREGVEAVRQVRDSNWLMADQNIQLCGDLVPWNYDGTTPMGAVVCGAAFTAGGNHLITGEYVPIILPNQSWIMYSCGAGGCSSVQKQLYTDTTSAPVSTYVRQFISAGAVTATAKKLSYSRVVKITLSTDSVVIAGVSTNLPYLDVVSTVTWNGVNSNNSVTVEEKLYNWK